MLKFTLFGFPVTVHWMFWVVTALLGGAFEASRPEHYQLLAVWVAACFISILVHELGHAFVMRHFGTRASIMLYGFGGLASGNAYWTRWQQVQVSLAGPLFGIILGLIFWQVGKISKNDPMLVSVFVSNMIWINIFWSLVNLLPVLPLDGGRVMEAALGNVRTAIIISIGTAALAAVALFLFTHSVYNALLFVMLAVQNYRRLQSSTTPWWPGMG